MSELTKKIEDYILKRIISGEYRPGDKLPPTTVLCDALNCSQPTVQTVYTDLKNRGYLHVYKNKTRGTFVSQSLPHQVNEVVDRSTKIKGKTYGERAVDSMLADQGKRLSTKNERVSFSVIPLAEGGWKFQFDNA